MIDLPPHGYITNFHNRIRSAVSNEFTDNNTVGIYINNSSGSNNNNFDEYGNISLNIGSRRKTTRRRINYSEDNFGKYIYSDSDDEDDYNNEDSDRNDSSDIGTGSNGKKKKRKLDSELLKEEYYKHIKHIIDPNNKDGDDDRDDSFINDIDTITDENGNAIKQVDYPSFDDPVNSENYLKFKQLKETITQGKLTRSYGETITFNEAKKPSLEKDSELDYESVRNVPITISFEDPLKPGNIFKDDLIWNINDYSLSIETFLEIYLLDLNINNEAVFNKILASIKEQILKYSLVGRLPVLNDLIIMIKIDAFLGRQNLRDLFYLNIRDDCFNLEEIVEIIVADLGLKREWLPILTHRILTHVLNVKQQILDNNVDEGVFLHLEDLAMGLRLDVENLGVEYQPVVMNLTKNEMEKRLEENGKRRVNHRRINRRNL